MAKKINNFQRKKDYILITDLLIACKKPPIKIGGFKILVNDSKFCFFVEQVNLVCIKGNFDVVVHFCC